MGPLIEAPQGKLLEALTMLGEGEEWLVKPRQLDQSMRLWSPGVRAGVAAGSAFHLTEYFGPVLGIMTAKTLAEAIELQNAVGYGLTAGIHSLDPDEIAEWSDRVEAGNLYVNRGITGSIVRRQPFGGWKRSAVGAGAKAGGPNYVMTLGDWAPVEVPPSDDIQLSGLGDAVSRVIKRAQAGLDFPGFDRVRVAALHDQRAWATEFGLGRDVSALGVERNVLRYRPVPVTIRLAEGAPFGDLARLIVAGALAGSPLWISSAVPLPSPLIDLFGEPAAPVTVRSVVVETDARWLARAQAVETRIRLAGGDATALAAVLGGNPDVAIYAGPVTTAGIELLPFLREQSVSTLS
jgi:RHH-type proline utilization regulon transcriptional repressor/proline dehydrogenase/delta 1-pyrroline-5-carboxylate dehydrogenase